MTIRKAIIPAAGLGTRFLPATKAQPKEMLPILDKPAIQYIVEEAAASGIEEIAIIIGRGKNAIQDHFDKSYELEETLQQKNRLSSLKEIQDISSLANIYYIRQKDPRGLGDAILYAKNFIANEPFAVLLGDDVVMAEYPCLRQLIDMFNHYNSSIVATQQVSDIDVSKYGIIKMGGTTSHPNLHQIEALIEKPKMEKSPSNHAIIGRYILRPEIFDILADLPIGRGNELQLTDAINELCRQQAVFAYSFEGQRYDIGEKVGFVKATIDTALKRKNMREEILSYIKDINTRS
ncbi:UTP--glucose-1-phosphate uridylyltransferase GalU [Virgibacillus sediminis]|uniref:UTP--glucose-1-phosphate uridylyltransferase n=1 Tax=Virgibacillus sediminis TaxID=202260 RepID=A0ABV7A371_9BACI